MLVWPRSLIVWAHSVATPQTMREAGGAQRRARVAANVTTRPSLIAALITSHAVMPCERLDAPRYRRFTLFLRSLPWLPRAIEWHARSGRWFWHVDIRVVASDCIFGLIGVDAGEDHDVGGDAANRVQARRQRRASRCVGDSFVGLKPAYAPEHSVCRPLTHCVIAGIPSQSASLRRESAKRRRQDPARAAVNFCYVPDRHQGTAAQ